MTPPSSSQAADPTQVEAGMWSKRMQLVVRKRTRDLLGADPHFKALKPRARRLMRLLVIWHDPATGHLMIRTKNATLAHVLECSETTLRRARHECIEAGFIAGYAPGDGGRGTGDGGWAGRYTISRTPEEAAEARALRVVRRKEIEAGIKPEKLSVPYWPAIPERERLGVPLLEERRGRPPADKSGSEESEQRQRRQRKTQGAPGRADMAHGANKSVAAALDAPLEPPLDDVEDGLAEFLRARGRAS